MIRHNPKLEEAANVWGLTAGDDIIDLRGKIYITYAGILRHAHAKTERPLRSIRISDPQSAGDTVWMRCTVEVQEPDGTRSTFEGIGDSFSTPKQIPPIRMAETRAKARALRTAYAIPFTGLEEMGEDLQTDDNLRSDLAKLAASPAAKEVMQIAEKDKAEAAAKSKQAERRQLDQGDEEKPIPRSPKTVIKEAQQAQEDPRKKLLGAIHARAKEIGIGDHEALKKFLPADFSMKEASYAELNAMKNLLNQPDMGSLQGCWEWVCSNGLSANLVALKDELKRLKVLGKAA